MWNAFETAVKQIQALGAHEALSDWDAETYMPSKAAEIRGEQKAALRGVIHEKLTGDRLGALLADVKGLALTPEQDAIVRATDRDRQRERQLPATFVTELSLAKARGVEAWKKARKTNDFGMFQAPLETLVELRRQEARLRGFESEPYDALLDANEPGMKTARLRPVLDRLRDALVPLVGRLTARPTPKAAFLTRDAWDTEAQYAFSLELIGAMGFDLEAGRLDRSAHPFCTSFAPTDVRLTTRLFRNDGANGFFSALHEAGHGLYEQGLPSPGTPACQAASMGLHESQSRLWENLVGRSAPFWGHFFPKLKDRFPVALEGVGVDDWVGAINTVRRSLIRVDSDEVTYNLHILVRFELELALVAGELKVADLPAAWNERYERVVGIRPTSDADGVLQDIHWSMGEFGYFPTYSLGNLYSASLFRAAERQIPGLWTSIGNGELLPLRDWLREHVHRHGRSKSAEEIVAAATGAGLRETEFVAYLTGKYGENA